MSIKLEYLLVDHPGTRRVVADGQIVGVTNEPIQLEGGVHEVRLDGDDDYAPLISKVELSGTDPEKPRVLSLSPIGEDVQKSSAMDSEPGQSSDEAPRPGTGKTAKKKTRKTATKQAPRKASKKAAVRRRRSPADLFDRASLAGYVSERIGPDDPDYMDVESEAEAFARFGVSTEVVPPLSIAVFGEWGSGKTFFMTKMSKHVEEVARLGRDSGSTLYHGNVVQIEFNAWHYIESNLWASLVQHIFDSLDAWLQAQEGGGAEVVDALFAQLATVKEMKREAAERQAEAERVLAEAMRDLRSARENYDHALVEHAKITPADVWTAVGEAFRKTVASDKELETQLESATETLGIADLRSSAQELHAAVAAARSTAGRGQMILSSMLGARGAMPGYGGLAVALIALPLVAGLGFAYLAPEGRLGGLLSEVGGVVAAASTAIATVTTWVGRAARTASRAIGSLEAVDASIQEIVDEKTRDHRQKVADAENYLESVRRSVEERDGQVERARLHVEDVKRQLAEASPRGHLNRFIRDRVASGEYARHLGIIATIRKDFETLTQLMGAVRDEAADARFREQEIDLDRIRKFDRIILYIDDLDRCPADRVVDVLQAVHLLLAFELFVVVVGVDSRWVSRALSERYPHLLDEGMVLSSQGQAKGSAATLRTDRRASSRDYLEKIFQVPFWVRPLDDDAAKEFITKLVDAPPRISVSATSRPSGAGARDGSVDPGKRDPDPADSDRGAEAAERAQKFLLEAQRMTLTDEEKKTIGALGPFVGHSPRRAKRFVNVYRIVKSGLRAKDQGVLLDSDGAVMHFRCLLAQLAIMTGAPSLAATYARVVDLVPDMEEDDTVNGLISRLEEAGAVAASPEWPSARGALEELIEQEGGEDGPELMAGLRLWLRRSMRFSFTAPTREMRIASRSSEP